MPAAQHSRRLLLKSRASGTLTMALRPRPPTAVVVEPKCPFSFHSYSLFFSLFSFIFHLMFLSIIPFSFHDKINLNCLTPLILRAHVGLLCACDKATEQTIFGTFFFFFMKVFLHLTFKRSLLCHCLHQTLQGPKRNSL